MNRKHIALSAIITALVCLTAFFVFAGEKNYVEIMAVTGATPLAVKTDVASGVTLEVSGLTKKVYTFDSSALNAFAPVYLRTREVSPSGAFEGTYRYAGIPVLHILEGVAPEKPKTAAFDRPLDMVVTFIAADGKQKHFSYGELTMADDSRPVVLAFHRKELRPSKETKGKAYTWNMHKGNVQGLRLVCPAEPDTSRYLDNVIKIVLRDIPVDGTGLPALKKGIKCSSDTVMTVNDRKMRKLITAGVKPASINGWVRTGHGQGFKGISNAQGFEMRDLLKKNFPGCGADAWFLFVACDGYRAMFSGREIFNTAAGKNMMLITKVDGKPAHGGSSLGPVSDYYVDRETWGLTHIIMIDTIEDLK
ncbi:MAG: hypothetical protein CVV44_21490 [Spirochaetae bacterium HGW-Spirochaetae-1]|jgi:hypothetical protein|nr:MAG: hypothetical protein CVV44_21490 [Spirochaetae bacterium HGW-Spirochaetae-1]